MHASMLRPRSITSLLLAYVAATTTFVRAAEPTTEKAPAAVLENDTLRVEVSSIGGKILSLRDKVRGREEVKVLSYIAGINEVRYQAVLGVNDTSSRFALTSAKDTNGNPTIVAVAHAIP